MSTGEEDRIARSVALEKTYVHDVYDHMSALQYPEHRNTTPWPKVKRFLNELEPGSIVCDVGCGNGKYLKVNPSIFKIGSDRCRKLTQIAKDDDNEVLLCDNLTLPFRDESFDAVLSIAVIHHFATKERRVGALRELARVLRIGGRLMITVWAMEQKDRKFETQDVLVQWHHPQFVRSPSLEFSTTATVTSEEDFALACRLSQAHASDDNDSIFSRSNSLRQDTRPGRSRLRLFQSLRSIKTSPSSSSLSSPNETCYSFVKKALQKLSRSNKKEKHHTRAWFLESWASFGKDDHLPATRYDPEGCEEDTNVQDLPIELRRMENETELQRSESTTEPTHHLLQVCPLTQKSKSLNDIQSQSMAAAAALPITRSRSSIVTTEGFKISVKSVMAATATMASAAAVATTTTTDATMAANVDTAELVDTLKPRLVKQKKSICEEDYMLEEQEEGRDQATDMKKLIKELPVFNVSVEKSTVEKYNVLKQKSLTEDIMSAERLKERETVRQNIQKQASLNEDLIYRRQRPSDSFRDTFLTSSSRKFQMFRSGLTSKLKSSTTNIEKVAGASLKSGFVRIFQSLTGGEMPLERAAADVVPPQPAAAPGLRKSSSEDRGDNYAIERRFSHEENSDSSKDNSLQSDTSIDSEDSIISVIERFPRGPDQSTSPTMLTSPGPHSPKMALTGVLSHPSSPKISQVMQYPAAKAKALSLPASPRTLVLSPSLKQTFKLPPVAQLPSTGNGPAMVTPNGKTSTSSLAGNGAAAAAASPLVFRDLKPPSDDEPILKLSPIEHVTAAKMKTFTNRDMMLLSQKLTVLSCKEKEPRDDVCEGDESQKSDTEQSLVTRKVHTTKPEEYLSRSRSEGSARTAFALVKKSSSHYHTFSQSHQARLQSYEIFNPETEDIDTDSSGVSTPDSFGSVISVKMDSSNGTPLTETAQTEIPDVKQPLEMADDKTRNKESSISILPSVEPTMQTEPTAIPLAHSKPESASAEIVDQALLEAAVSVVSSLESAVDTVLKQRDDEAEVDSLSAATITSLASTSPPPTPKPSISKAKESRRASTPSLRHMTTTTTTTITTTSSSAGKSPGEHETWDRECRQHLVDLAENLSERLLAEIDRCRELNVSVEESNGSGGGSINSTSSKYCRNAYLTKLSEELSHVSKLTRELSEDLDTRSGGLSSRIEIESSRLEVVEGEGEEDEDEDEDKDKDEVEEEEKAEESEEKMETISIGPDIIAEMSLDPNNLRCEQSTEAESPGSISGWLDSRRNTIESGIRQHNTEESRAGISGSTGNQQHSEEQALPHPLVDKSKDDGGEEVPQLQLVQPKSLARRRKLSRSSDSGVTTRLSTESTDTLDTSERTASSDDGNIAKRDTVHAECSSGRLSIESDVGEPERAGRHGSVETRYSGSQASLLRPGESIESSDAGDISERTGSVSDFSRQNTESRSVITQSSASLASWSDCSKDIRFADRRTNRCDGRSSSEETNPRAVLTRQEAATQEPMDVKLPNADTSISRSTSQDSLTSESGGGSIMFHRYYHVFREGELDSLIDEFVENLHIISSYYDHTNWCIIAEKVRVWTI